MRLSGVLALLILTASRVVHAQEEIPLAEPRLVPVPPDAPTWRPGEPAPPGFTVEHHANSNLVTVGSRLLASHYVLAVLTGAVARTENQTGWLFVPLAGPWLTLARRDTSCDAGGLGDCVSEGTGEALLAAWLVALGVGQAAGTIVLGVGVADRRERLVYTGEGFSVSPMRIGKDGHGLGVRAAF